jgi:polyisoprenoid-binding protein YceI
MSTTATLQIAPGTYSLDPVHSNVGFSVRHNVVATFRGGFSDYAATLQADESGKLSLRGEVNVASVQVKDENLAGHLQSPDFFDAQQYPKIVFTSDDLRIADDGKVAVTGELTLKGHTETVEATGNVAYVEAGLGGAARVGIELETKVDRTKYGLDWNAPLPKGGFALGNDVKLHVELELTAPAAEQE